MLTLCSRPLHATTPSDSGYPPSQGLISAWRKRRGTVLIDDNGRVIRHKRIHHHSDLSSPSTHAPNPSRVPPTPCIPISNETCCYPNAHAMPIANPTTSQEANPVHYDLQSPTYILHALEIIMCLLRIITPLQPGAQRSHVHGRCCRANERLPVRSGAGV